MRTFALPVRLCERIYQMFGVSFPQINALMRAYEDCMFVTIERKRPKAIKSRSLEQQPDTTISPDILSSSLPELEFTDAVIQSKPLPLPRKPRPVPRSRTISQAPPKPAPRVPRATKVVLRKVQDRPTSVSR